MVTGAAGFLGGYVVSELLRAGHEVVIFDSEIATGVRVLGASIICGNLLDLSQLTTASQGIDAICHLAGVGDVYLAASEPATAAAANVVGTTNVAEAARRNGVGRVVYASTWEVYGKPEHQPVRETHPCPDRLQPRLETLWLERRSVLSRRLGRTAGRSHRSAAMTVDS
jgi:UDP-glucose 4-epimerase